MLIKNQIIQKSKEIGFDKIGFAEIRELKEHENFLNNWIANEYNANMKYFERNIKRRCNPKLIMNDAKTIIVTATKYLANIEFLGKYRIAKYALQNDYHDAILYKLKLISEYLGENFDAKTTEYVDVGTILEKQWAVLAGIGWQGKNSLVLNNEIGSYFNLGVIITDLEIEYDKPMQNECGKCTICMEKCPTHAIVSPGVIDSKKCIAYQTIEMKETEILNITHDYGQKFIFGCDICQDVCPYNSKHIKPTNIEINVELDLLTNLTEENFNQVFKNSVIKRRKYNGLIRNAEYANS